jgi:hypothetical protein
MRGSAENAYKLPHLFSEDEFRLSLSPSRLLHLNLSLVAAVAAAG